MFREIGEERAFNGILEQIIENVQNGSLKAGDALPAERNMAETMKVSRSAVREALRALELLGIIEAVPGGGNYITDNLDTWLIGPLTILFRLNHSYMRQNQQLRAALERQNAILAAKKCTPLDAAELLMILARIDAAAIEALVASPLTTACAGMARSGGQRLPSTSTNAGCVPSAATARAIPAIVAQRMLRASISCGLTKATW